MTTNYSLKQKADHIIESRQLCSYMNDTKWNELRDAMMNEMPFQPAFIVKFVIDEDAPDDNSIKNDVFGDWYYGLSIDRECFNAFFVIEWVKIRPWYMKKRGALVADEKIDASPELEALLRKYSIPYESENGLYCIYGYR